MGCIKRNKHTSGTTPNIYTEGETSWFVNDDYYFIFCGRCGSWNTEAIDPNKTEIKWDAVIVAIVITLGLTLIMPMIGVVVGGVLAFLVMIRAPIFVAKSLAEIASGALVYNAKVLNSTEIKCHQCGASWKGVDNNPTPTKYNYSPEDVPYSKINPALRHATSETNSDYGTWHYNQQKVEEGKRRPSYKFTDSLTERSWFGINREIR